MKNQTEIKTSLIKHVVNALIDQETREWPPECLGFFYQPPRPQHNTHEEKKEK